MDPSAHLKKTQSAYCITFVLRMFHFVFLPIIAVPHLKSQVIKRLNKVGCHNLYHARLYMVDTCTPT